MDKRRLPCLAVIPARGGSKGIPLKNIQPIGGKPLLVWAIEALKRSDIDAYIAISTDSEEIIAVARRYCNERTHILKRPPSISADSAKTEDALIDALEQIYQKYGKKYGSVMTVQPTSPFRKPSTIRDFKNAFDRNPECDAMLTLNAVYTDFWIEEEGGYHRLNPEAPRRRQDRDPLYAENSCLYITEVDSLLETGSVLGRKVQGFLINDREAIDINEPIDLLIAQVLSDAERTGLAGI